MFCNKCGGNLAGAFGGFCPKCGMPLLSPQSTQMPGQYGTMPQAPGQYVAPVYNKPSGGNKKLLLFGGLGLVIAAIIAVTAFLLLGGGSIVGTWQFESAQGLDRGEELWFGSGWRLTFYQDGTGREWTDLYGNEDFTWTIRGDVLIYNFDWGNLEDIFNVSGNRLTLQGFESDAVIWIFRRVN